MEDLWSHQTLFGMLGFCSSFLSQPKPTRAPRRLIVLSCRRWKHTTILIMVIIDFIAIMSILDIIVFKCDRPSLDPVLFPPDIFRQLYDINVSLLLLRLLSLLILFELFRMARICWFLDFVRARLQETGSVRHTYSEYPGKTASCTRRRHGDNSTPPAQPLSWRAWRLQAGCWRWMPDVVCQLVGIWMVP